MESNGMKARWRVSAAVAVAVGSLLVFALPSGAAPQPSSGNDTCGYPSSSFTESTVMRWAQIQGQGTAAQIVAYANDEKGLLLGVNGATPDTSAQSNGPDSYHASSASGGSPTATDPSGRVFFPALYITNVTNSSTNAGDWQNGGTPRNISNGTPFVIDVFGTWSTADVSNGKYTVTPPPVKNNWDLGSGSDAPVGTTFQDMGNEGYGAEVRWNVGDLTDSTGQPLAAGNTYRVQIIEHDGDQNKSGGDAGEFCVNLTIPGSPPPPPPPPPPPFKHTPAIRVVKFASVQCANLFHGKGVMQPAVAKKKACTGTWSKFTRKILTVTVPRNGSYAITIDYQIRVFNTGKTPLKLSWSDPRCDAGTKQGPVNVSGLSGDTLAAGGKAYYTCSHTLTQNDPNLHAPGEPFTNAAVVTGQPPSGPPVHGRSRVTVHRAHVHGPPPVCRNLKTGRPIHYRPGHKPAACKPQGPQNPRGFTG